jgi:SAM-dependent methyltransferase
MPRTDESSAREMARYWDGIGDAWTEQHLDPVWRTHSDAVYAALLERWLPAKKLRRILKTDLFDEAVAEGLYPVVQARAERVTGFDVSPRIAAAACARYPRLEGIVADARRLPFDDGKFDAVISLSTLDHFASRDDIRRALVQLHRVLAPGGTLVITLDNASNPVVALRNGLPYPLLRGLGLVPYRMGVTCSSGRFLALLGSCGFDVRDVDFVVHCPRVIAVLASRLIERAVSRAARARFLRLLATCERLGRWPTRALTGYYTAALATRR